MSHSKHSPWKTILALLGFFLYLLSLIITFVMVVEYDPLGKTFKEEGVYHTVTRAEDQIHVRDTAGNMFPLLRTPESSRAVPETIGGYLHPTKEGFLPEYLIPHVPRSAEDMVIPLFFLFLSIVFMRLAPSVLFVDVLAHD